MEKKSVSVVIPNFNGELLLKKYLPPLYEALESSSYISDYEVIIIDDASTDDSVAFIKSNYAKVILLQNSENSGFSKTTNKGIFAAKMDLALLLNTDMFLPNDFFDVLIPYFFSNPSLFGISPTIKNEQGDADLEIRKLPVRRNSYFHYEDVVSTEACSAFYLCGGCALIDRLKLTELNGLDEIYSPFYFEDTDLSVRAWLNGWACMYTPEISVRHCHSITVNKYFSKEYVQLIFTRNKLLFNYFYLTGFYRFRFFLKNYSKYILGKILPSKSKTRFNSAFEMFKKLEERKIKRRELMQLGKGSPDKIILLIFNN